MESSANSKCTSCVSERNRNSRRICTRTWYCSCLLRFFVGGFPSAHTRRSARTDMFLFWPFLALPPSRTHTKNENQRRGIIAIPTSETPQYPPKYKKQTLRPLTKLERLQRTNAVVKTMKRQARPGPNSGRKKPKDMPRRK